MNLSEAASIALRTGKPNEMLGTKTPSMTSMCIHCAAFVNHPRVAVEMAEVGGKHRRGDNAFHGVLKQLHKGKAISEINA